MFPGPVQKFFAHFIGLSGLAFKTSYSFGRNALWILASSATIMVLPVVFESERAQQQEQQLQQQRQVTTTALVVKMHGLVFCMCGLMFRVLSHGHLLPSFILLQSVVCSISLLHLQCLLKARLNYNLQNDEWFFLCLLILCVQQELLSFF